MDGGEKHRPAHYNYSGRRDIVRVTIFCFFKGKVSLLSQQSPNFLLCEGIYIGIRGKIHHYRSKNCLYRNVAPF